MQPQLLTEMHSIEVITVNQFEQRYIIDYR
jgi:hypothetical protein